MFVLLEQPQACIFLDCPLLSLLKIRLSPLKIVLLSVLYISPQNSIWPVLSVRRCTPHHLHLLYVEPIIQHYLSMKVVWHNGALFLFLFLQDWGSWKSNVTLEWLAVFERYHSILKLEFKSKWGSHSSGFLGDVALCWYCNHRFLICL